MSIDPEPILTAARAEYAKRRPSDRFTVTSAMYATAPTPQMAPDDRPIDLWPVRPFKTRIGEAVGPYVTFLVISAVIGWCLFALTAISVWSWNELAGVLG